MSPQRTRDRQLKSEHLDEEGRERTAVSEEENRDSASDMFMFPITHLYSYIFGIFYSISSLYNTCVKSAAKALCFQSVYSL